MAVTSTMSLADAQSPFRKALLLAQRDEEKTLRDATTTFQASLARVFGGIALGAMMFGGIVFIPAMSLLLKYGLLIPIAFIGLGLGQTVATLFTALRATRIVQCPRCESRYRLFQNVEKYTCSRCQLPFRLDASTTTLTLGSCPHCLLQFAVGDSIRTIRCFNCGAVLELEQGHVSCRTGKPCSSCSCSLPEGAFVCARCLNVQRPDDEWLMDDSTDAMLGRGAVGIIAHVRTRIGTLLQRLQETHEPINMFEDVKTIESVLSILTKETELQNARYLDVLRTLAGELDEAYARLLLSFYRMSAKATYPIPNRLFHRMIQKEDLAHLRSEMAHLLQSLQTSSGANEEGLATTLWKRPVLDSNDYTAELHPGQHVVYTVNTPELIRDEAYRICPLLPLSEGDGKSGVMKTANARTSFDALGAERRAYV